MKLEKGVIVTDKAWYRVPARLLRDSRLTGADIGVFAVIADRADGDTCTMAAADIAAELDVCKLTVKRAVSKLADYGYIAVERKAGKPSVYRQLLLAPKRRSTDKAARSEPRDISKYDFVIEQSMAEIDRELKEAK